MVEWGTGDRDSHKDAGVKWVHFFCGLYRARLIWSRIRIRPWPERSKSGSGSDRGRLKHTWMHFHFMAMASLPPNVGVCRFVWWLCANLPNKRGEKGSLNRVLEWDWNTSGSAGCLCNSVHRSLRCINHTQCGLLYFQATLTHADTRKTAVEKVRSV